MIIETGQRKEKRINDLKTSVLDMFDKNLQIIELLQNYMEKEEQNLAFQIIELEDQLDLDQQEILIQVNNFIIQEQPKAIDLRFALGINVIASECEIIGDYYKALVKQMIKTGHIKSKHEKLLVNLLATIKINLEETKYAFENLSHDLAKSISRRKEEVEVLISKLTEDINNLLIEANNYNDVKDLTRILNISRIFDRTFAHLIVICEQITYINNGQLIHYA